MMLPKKIFFFLVLFVFSEVVFAQKLSLGFGAYSISAKVDNSETSISNLGSYKIQYHSTMTEEFELLLGFSILMVDIVAGDKAFGPFVGFSYFPFGNKTVNYASHSNISILKIGNYNPYAFAGFTQRQYQSVKSTYSGFTFGGGVEMGWSKLLSFFADASMGLLAGPNEGGANEMSMNIGIMYNY